MAECSRRSLYVVIQFSMSRREPARPGQKVTPISDLIVAKNDAAAVPSRPIPTAVERFAVGTVDECYVFSNTNPGTDSNC